MCYICKSWQSVNARTVANALNEIATDNHFDEVLDIIEKENPDFYLEVLNEGLAISFDMFLDDDFE